MIIKNSNFINEYKSRAIIISLILIGIYFQSSIFAFKFYRWNQEFKIFMVLGPIILLIILLPNYIIKNKLFYKKKVIITLLYYIIYELIYSIIEKQNIIGLFLPLFLFLSIISLMKVEKINMYMYIYRIISILLLFSLISYLLVNLKINTSLEIIRPDHLLKEKNGVIYLKHFLYTTIARFGKIQNIRFYGFFDEPGTLGTLIGMIFLFDNNYKILKKERIILLISGLLTLSMAFYIFLFLKFLVFPINFFKKIGIGVLLFLVIVYGNFYLKKNYEILYKNTYLRVIKQENNRTSKKAKIILDKFYKTDNFYLGTGKNFNISYPKVDISSWHNIVYQKGFLGLSILICYIFYITQFFKRNNQIKLLILIFMISIYQRPRILMYLNFLILLSGIEYYEWTYKRNLVKNGRS